MNERSAHLFFVRETEALVQNAQRDHGAALAGRGMLHAQRQRDLFKVVARGEQLLLVDGEHRACAAGDGDDVHETGGGKAREFADPLSPLDPPLVLGRSLAAPRTRIARDGEIFAAHFSHAHPAAIVAHDDRLFGEGRGQRDPDIVSVRVPRIIGKLFKRRFCRAIGLAEQRGKARVHREMSGFGHDCRRCVSRIKEGGMYPGKRIVSLGGAARAAMRCEFARIFLALRPAATGNPRSCRRRTDRDLVCCEQFRKTKAPEDMTDALGRIAGYFEEFRQSIERCRSADAFKAVDWKDAHGALGRLRERYEHEKDDLTPEQQKALRKVFEDDVFIKGMMELRQVGEHVVRRGGPTIYTTGNAPVHLTVESSAMAVFAGPVVTLPDIDGKVHKLDHGERLEEALRRIGAALAKTSLPD